MSYLDAVIKESMRLYPVAPFIVRKLTNHVDVSSSGNAKQQPPSAVPNICLPNDALACIWIYSLHRHPDFWNQPHEFVPERWLIQAATERDIDRQTDSLHPSKDRGITTPGAYIPYAIGARNCLGQPLANIVLRIMLARLIYRYEFRDERVTSLLLQQASVGEPLTSSQVDHLRKDMQAGFTILPQGGLTLSIQPRNFKSHQGLGKNGPPTRNN
jgi:cytochrome P450